MSVTVWINRYASNKNLWQAPVVNNWLFMTIKSCCGIIYNYWYTHLECRWTTHPRWRWEHQERFHIPPVRANWSCTHCTPRCSYHPWGGSGGMSCSSPVRASALVPTSPIHPIWLGTAPRTGRCCSSYPQSTGGRRLSLYTHDINKTKYPFY